MIIMRGKCTVALNGLLWACFIEQPNRFINLKGIINCNEEPLLFMSIVHLILGGFVS